jgi:hypothetical protein
MCSLANQKAFWVKYQVLCLIFIALNFFLLGCMLTSSLNNWTLVVHACSSSYFGRQKLGGSWLEASLGKKRDRISKKRNTQTHTHTHSKG